MVSLVTNSTAWSTQRALNRAQSSVVESQRNLSTGMRINAASDDAAGLQISNRLGVEARGVDVAMNNIVAGESVAEVAQGALENIADMVIRLRELALQSAGGVNSAQDRDSLQQEARLVVDDINRVATTTSFAGERLFSGLYGTRSFHLTSGGNAIPLTLRDMRPTAAQTGGEYYLANKQAAPDWKVRADARQIMIQTNDGEHQNQQKVTLNIGDNMQQVATLINARQSILRASVNEKGQLQLFIAARDNPQNVSLSGSFIDDIDLEQHTEKLSLNDIDISTQGGAQLGISLADAALGLVDSHRAEIGTFSNRLQSTVNHLQLSRHSLLASKGQIADTDYAKSSTHLVRANILQEANTALLAQANERPEAAVNLLK